MLPCRPPQPKSTLDDPVGRSDPLPLSQSPRSLPSPPLLSSLLLPVASSAPPPPPATPLPPAAPSDAGSRPAITGFAPDRREVPHLAHSDPLPPPPEDLPPIEDLLDVTYIYPQLAAETTPLTLPAAPSGVAPLPAAIGALAPADPDAGQESYDLPPPSPEDLPRQ